MQQNNSLKKYLLQYADAFSASTGLATSLLGLYGESYGGFGDPCSQCKYGSPKKQHLCEDVHLYGILQSFQQNKMIEYSCLSGLSFFAFPMGIENAEQYFLRVGPYCKETLGAEEFMQEQAIVLSQNVINKMCFLLSASVSEKGKTIVSTEVDEKKSYIAEMLSALQSFGQPQGKDYFQQQMQIVRQMVEEHANQPFVINEKVNELLGYLFYGLSAPFSVLRAKILELLLLFAEDTVYETRLEEIYHLKIKEDLYFWLSQNMSDMIAYALRISSAKHTDTIKKAIEYMKANVSQHISLEQVAATIYLSPTYFSKIFREHTGDTFSSYLNKLRVQKSKRMLEKTQQSLVKIASQCGFEDDSYFNKVFKRYVGITPKQYRKSFLKEI